MKIKGAGVEFESRRELERLIAILEQWQSEHQESENKETAQRLTDIAEILYIGW